MAVVRSGGKEKPVLETRREITDGLGDLRINRVSLPGRRCRMVRFVQNEERPRKKRPEPVAESRGVRIVDEQAVRDQQPRVRGPVLLMAAFLAGRGCWQFMDLRLGTGYGRGTLWRFIR